MQNRDTQNVNQRLVPGSADAAGGIRKMDNAELRETAERGQMSVIGADIVVTGNIEASVDLHIEG